MDKDKILRALEKLAANPDLEDEILLSNNPKKFLKYLRKKDVSSSFLIDVMQSPDPKIRKQVFNHPNLPRATKEFMKKKYGL